MKIVLAHAKAYMTDKPARFQLQQASQRATFGQRWLNLDWIMDQHTVEIVDVQNSQLIFDIADHPFGGIVGRTFAIEAPLRRRMAAEPACDNDNFSRNFL